MNAPPAIATVERPGAGLGTAALEEDAPRVTVVTDPDDAPACLAEVQACHALDRGVVVCLPPPGSVSRSQLAANLLVALGKSPGAPAAQRPTGLAWDLAGRWLAAERVTDLVVLGAHRLPPARWADLAILAATTGSRLWLVVHGTDPTREQRAALTTAHAGRVLAVWPWPAGLSALPHADAEQDGGFPAVPDVEFSRFRAAARRVLAVGAFTRVDAVYRDTFAHARAHADDLRLSLLSRVSRADLIDAVLQQLTIDATSTDEVLTRVRAAQAGLFAEGLFVDLRPQLAPTRRDSAVRLEPRLDPATVARLRCLADPATAAAVLLSCATGLPPAALCRLHAGALTEHRGGLHIRLSSMLGYRIPARAAGLLRAVLPPDQAPAAVDPTGTGDTAIPIGASWLFAHDDGALLDERALTQLRDQGVAYAGVTLLSGSFRTGSVIDLRGLPGVGR